ncbi:MAG: hypothetical protein HUJ51_01055 [Eggerthellaceae bacterium]|nr:hypothetical protein [Eggerthellaceae bacterium]
MSEKLHEQVVSAGAAMINNSSAFRMFVDVALIVLKVNPNNIIFHFGDIGDLNCLTIKTMITVVFLNRLSKIKPFVTSIYRPRWGQVCL